MSLARPSRRCYHVLHERSEPGRGAAQFWDRGTKDSLSNQASRIWIESAAYLDNMPELFFEFTSGLVDQRLPAEPVWYNLNTVNLTPTALVVDLKEEQIGDQLREVEGRHPLGSQPLLVKPPELLNNSWPLLTASALHFAGHTVNRSRSGISPT